ncbi:hypothetical protein [uncultured Paracoccus sp.]|uniref:hypothetical protein n=1 Tax=uncultured Paracoccus sp. TaxID=189685 RepID=UPI002630CAA3|nr:hypothetical protein [uncultured Paracoccus sp.]
MDRNQFIIATAVALFTAFILGWFASWLIHRLSRVSRAELEELDRMAQQLHDAEQARDAALTRLERRDAEMATRLAAADAERQVAINDLREAHVEVEELRDYIERRLNRS